MNDKEYQRKYQGGKVMKRLINTAFMTLREKAEIEPIFIQFIDGLYSVQIGWTFDHVGRAKTVNKAVARAVALWEMGIKNEELAMIR